MPTFKVTTATSRAGGVTQFSETVTSASTLTIDPDAFLVSYENYGAELKGTANWTANINGHLFGKIAGLAVQDQAGDDASTVTIAIGKDGSVGGDGVAIAAFRSMTLANSGTIFCQGFGIATNHAGTNTISNAGTIAGQGLTNGASIAMFFQKSSNDTVKNTGSIFGGIVLSDGANTLVNTGKITTSEEFSIAISGVSGGDGADKFTNKGLINGSVFLDEGTNTVVNSGKIASTGLETVSVAGGTGKDTITNSKTGVLTKGVDLAAGTNTLTNAGKIGSNNAEKSYEGQGGADRITNTGTMTGDMDVGNGRNVLTNSGFIDGQYIGGEDADTVKNQTGGEIGGFIDLGDGTNALTNAGKVSFISGGAGVDTIVNTGKISLHISLFDGNDVMTNTGTIGGETDLGAGDDTYNGGNAAERVVDGFGADTINFGGGNDFFRSFGGESDGTDTVDGGAGRDHFSAERLSQGIRINLDTVSHKTSLAFPALTTAKNTALTNDGLKIDNIKNFEDATGSAFDDVIYGTKAANKLVGGDGADVLFGFGGNDILIGSGVPGAGGEDAMIGGTGADKMTASGGGDGFVYTSLIHSGTTSATRDRIYGFTDDDDSIQFIGALSGKFTKLLFANEVFSGTDGELRARHTATGHIIEGDIDGDKKADISIAVRDLTHSIEWNLNGDFLT